MGFSLRNDGLVRKPRRAAIADVERSDEDDFTLCARTAELVTDVGGQ
jgi:hypothetical protein